MPIVHDRIIGQIDGQIRIFHTFQFYNGTRFWQAGNGGEPL